VYTGMYVSRAAHRYAAGGRLVALAMRKPGKAFHLLRFIRLFQETWEALV